MIAYAAMAEMALSWVTVCMVGATACGFPRPPDLAGDAAADVQPDARTCFGDDPFKVCFASAPTGAIDISTATTFDTVYGTISGTPLTCATPMSGGTGYCVLAARTIMISTPLRAVGTRPLVLVAADSITVPTSASVDVGSHRVPVESIGAGADSASGCNEGTAPTTANGTSGGGAGATFIGGGGSAGNGGNAGGGAGQRAPGISTVITVRGGCPGQDGAGDNKGALGHGGGAVFLLAGSRITMDGTILAGGEDGGGATGMSAGGGGGGSGGMIGFNAPTIAVTGAVIANGGGGGAGAATAGGQPGSDAVTTDSAAGGAGGSGMGGDGGVGSSGSISTSGAFGHDGSSNMGVGGGGGGGGGGAGLIKGPPASLGPNVSPPATP
jgi:hypothetical protein